MIENRESILIFEADIDLQYLKGILEKENYTTEFESSTEGFISKCKRNKYSAFVLSARAKDCVDESIVSAISWSQNIFTPVMVVCPEVGQDILTDLQRYKFELISFPISTEEFLFRVRKMIRLKQNEESVHNNLLKYRSLFDNFPLGIVQTDQHGGFIIMNRAFASFTNMTEADIFKENFFQLCHPDDYFIERKQLDRLLRKEVDTVNFEIRLINNDGITCICKVIVSSFWESDNQFSHFSFVLEKIS